jgi:hypothetical protein
MADPISLTHPETGEVWTSGKRGRKPLWVCAMMAGEPLPKVDASKTKDDSKLPGALRVWRLTGVAGESGDNDKHQQHGHCLIVAADEFGAIQVANPTFRNPIIGKRELELMWSELSDVSVAELHASGINCTVPGIYESTDEGMKPRPKIHR